MSPGRDLSGKGLAVMLGSGLGEVCAGWPVSNEVPFESIPGLSAGCVDGHEGVIRTCNVGGRSGLFIVGRKHGYEGNDRPVRALVDHIAGLGVTHLLLTSASGSLTRSIRPGEIGIAEDLVDFQFRSPASPIPLRTHVTGGAGREAFSEPSRPLWGERPAAGRLGGLDPAFAALVRRAAGAAGVSLHRGVMASMMGPTYETPSEVAMLQIAGAHFVTMSAAPEIEFAASRGVAVAALAIITNYATGISSDNLAHKDVLRRGGEAAGRVRALIEQLIILK